MSHLESKEFLARRSALNLRSEAMRTEFSARLDVAEAEAGPAVVMTPEDFAVLMMKGAPAKD